MARKLFGTDGIRGKANEGAMTADVALRVAQAAGSLFQRGDHRHRVVIGKDTRLSGYLLEPALTAGFISMGMDVILLGPTPTPAVAMLTTSLRADLGVMISASHNPYEDNGIKLFGPDGYKLSDALEEQIEGLMENTSTLQLAASAKLGRASRLEDTMGRYGEWVKGTFPKGLRLDGLKVVIDCAHGAAYKVAPAVLWELGADVVPIAVQPDGRNINAKCGATAPEAMQEAVVMHGAHIGLALDGDADRLIVADEKGRKVDGDQLMALIATSWQDRNLLRGDGIVATVMSNLSLENYLASRGLKLHRTPVGDRYVAERMRDTGCNVGGEQSGHMIMHDYGTAGDGLITALQVLAVLKQSNRKASEVLSLFKPMPQILNNVRVTSTNVLEQKTVRDAITAAEKKLGSQGRILIRKSGTEPLIRVMVEGEDETTVHNIVNELSSLIKSAAA